MAKPEPSAKPTVVTVEKNDTLYSIADDYLGSGSKYKTLAAINDIYDPSKIQIGDKITLYKKNSSSTSSKKKTSSNKPTIKKFGIQSDSENTIFATWSWNKDHTDHYKTMWYYATGNGVWFVGSDSTTNFKQSTYSIPQNAKKVKFKVKPIGKTYKKKGKDTKWTANWSTEKIHTVAEKPPEKPSTPSLEINDKNKFILSIDNVAEGVEKIQFELVKNNTSGQTRPVSVTNAYAAWEGTATAGAEYKARCRAVKDSLYSDWSDYSGSVPSLPSAPKGIETLKTLSETSVYITWTAVPTATSYIVAYTTNQSYFYSSPDNVTTKQTDGAYNAYTITGLESGKQYFFRVCAVNEKGESTWTGVKSLIVGKKPSAPTTWSSTTTAITDDVGEKIYLYWTHNSEDGSSQTYANLELTTVLADGRSTKEIKNIPNSTEEDKKDKTSVYEIDTSAYKEAVAIKWRVQTKGIHASYSDWSILRSIDIYARPYVDLGITDADGKKLDELTSFPFYVNAVPGPNTQAPIGYHVEIIANNGYETVDIVGNPKVVSKGDSVYSNFFDISNQALVLSLSANNLDLENGKSYTAKCIVSMDSGLTAEASSDFTVSWTDEEHVVTADISVDPDELTASITPRCESREAAYYIVTLNSGVYTKTDEIVDTVYGEIMDGVKTTTGEEVYSGVYIEENDEEDIEHEIYYCEVITSTPVEGVTLAVYRREYDGRFTEIETGIPNDGTTVYDPHPALDFARYRIVAIDDATGAVSYYDMPGEPVGEPAVIIQWDEQWTSYNTMNEDAMEELEYTRSMLKLPYNIDVSESNDSDVSFVEYVGRSHPVSYYGTQLGVKDNWNVEIPKDDKETLYALRRLKIWMGDVYVREPSGTGYWANIKVKLDQKHKGVTIPVSLDITRVEGGM